MARSIDNSDDVIDSRDVIARIEELEAELEDAESWTTDGSTPDEAREELAALRKLAEQGESLDDWEHGACLIRDSYFVRHAKELADDMGVVDRYAHWPYTCIDWEQAASELQQDYTSIDFDGVTYWAR